MAKYIEPPANIQIAAMQNNKSGVHDLMRPGPGVPWEDRGSLGAVPAFLKTCVRSITSPRLLLDHLRRPNTTSDATAFAIGCGLLWSLSVLVHNAIFLWRDQHNPKLEVNQRAFIVAAVLQALVTTPMLLLLLRICSGIYRKLIVTEMKSDAPPSLTYNLFAYSLGPSLLAPIPVVGPVIALAWIFADLIIAGRKRLYIVLRGAIINAFIVLFVAAVLTVGGYFVVKLLWWQLIGSAVQEKQQVMPPPLRRR